ncbi:MAG TPA: T9SS type A sorting domain-containing protein, partial [Chitinophagaceae bacterium]
YFNGPGNEFPFVIANNGAILPIDYFITTHAQKINNLGIIKWTVTDVNNVNSFEVQRSVNNSGFHTIGMVNPVVNQTDFSFTDASLVNGTNLYRIKVNRITGSSKYSNTVAIIQNSNDLLITTVAPNPVHNSAMLTISTGRPAVVSFKVYNMTGSLVKQWQSNMAEGNNTIELNVSELPAGVYSIFASNMEANTVSRFVKQ